MVVEEFAALLIESEGCAGILKRLHVQVNQPMDVADVVAVHPFQRRDAEAAVSGHLSRVWRQVLRGTELQRARQHLFRAASQRLIAQACWVADENAAGVVGVTRGDRIDLGAGTTAGQQRGVDPDVALGCVDIHFDYSASNRARYMQGNVARVALQFKQYAQNMTYLLGRAAYLALKDESEEVRTIARRQLVATLGSTFVMAGALGLPGIGAAMGLLGVFISAMDDDDKPWDWKVWLRNLLADAVGKEVGEVIAHGVPRALMSWDLSNRVGMGDLWLRSNDRQGQSARDAFATDMTNILGPSAGTLLGLYTASDHMARGNWSKAVESLVPKAIRDPLQAVRIATEGITSYSGEHLMGVTAAESIGRALGFSPARAAEMYESANAVKNAETAVMEKRKLLISRAARARMDGDTETGASVADEIRDFNRRNPAELIKGESIIASVLARRRHERQTINGAYLPVNRDHFREAGRFAETE